MKEKIENLKQEIALLLPKITTNKEFYETQSAYLGKSGKITSLLRELGKAPKEDRPQLGKAINDLKVWAENAFLQTEKFMLAGCRLPIWRIFQFFNVRSSLPDTTGIGSQIFIIGKAIEPYFV